MVLHLPLKFDAEADAPRLREALLVPAEVVIVGFRVEAESLLVSLALNAWFMLDLGQPTVEAVTRYVERQLA